MFPSHDPAPYGLELKHHNMHEIRASDIFHSFTFHELDITHEIAKISHVFEGVDAIIHLAALAGVQLSLKDPMRYQRVNVEATNRLLEIARLNSIKRFVFASSSSVYGWNGASCKNDDQPISPYAASKRAGELLGHVYSSLYDIDFSALRFFTVYGPRCRPDMAIGRFIKSVIDGEMITLFGDGTSSRDYTHI